MNFNFDWSRRSFLSALGALSGSLLAPSEANAEKLLAHKTKGMAANVDGSPIVPITSGLGSSDIYEALGVKPLININGTVTVIGGSVMKPEVMELMRQGNQHFVLIDELEAAAGKHIAKLCKSPVGYTGLVTGGAAAALVVGYSGMMTEDWENRIREVPDITNCPRHEVIIQKAHRYAFDHQIRQTGAKLIEVETREQMIAAINPKTVAIHFTNIQSDRGKVNGPETVEIARAHGIYTFNDASADVPPVSRLWEYPAVGFDLVTFSGGKDICGPQASGILIGKEELIRYSLLNMSPQEDRIGRCCKVGKETIFALLKALELFVNQDYEATLKMYDARAQVITDAVAKFGVTALPRQFNPEALGNVTPHYSWKIDSSKYKITGQEVLQQLADTKPVGIGSMGAGASGMRGRWPEGQNPEAQGERSGQAAATAGGRRVGPGGNGGGRPARDPGTFGFAVWQIKDGEDKIIADRLVEILSQAPKA
jgi:seryl-tRNA(Sec) selenium transferase